MSTTAPLPATSRLASALGRIEAAGAKASQSTATLVAAVADGLDRLSNRPDLKTLNQISPIGSAFVHIKELDFSGAACKELFGKNWVQVAGIYVGFVDPAGTLGISFQGSDSGGDTANARVDAATLRGLPFLHDAKLVDAALTGLEQIAERVEQRAAQLDAVAGGAT